MTKLKILLLDTRNQSWTDRLALGLSASSLQHLTQIGTDGRRLQFTLGRWLMAQAAGCPIDQVEEGFNYPVYAGKPHWHMSLSHSGSFIAAVFSEYARFGLDVEAPSRQRDCLALARRAFTSDEAVWVASAPAEQQAARFYRIWTLREAAFKAGILQQVVNGAAVFDPANECSTGNFHWQYWQQQGLHLSVVGPVPFTIELSEINLPTP